MRIKIWGRIIYIPKWLEIAFVIVFIIILILSGYIISRKKAAENEFTEITPDISKEIPSSEKENNTADAQASPVSESPDSVASPTVLIPKISVYIVGCVNKPSLVTVPEDSMIIDAVNAAGGLTGDADTEAVNMAQPLSDHMMIKIPSRKETSDSPSKNYITMPEASDNSPDKKNGASPVNLNTATAEMLCTIPGIGESTAAKIISYREEHGFFESTEDIMKISGIKEAKYNAIKDFITV